MATLHISMLGRFQLQSNGMVPPGFGAQKELELFGYLLTHRATPHHREKLATILWQDASSDQSRQYFRKALWQLQTALDKIEAQTPLLIVESEWVQLNADADLRLDLRDFEATFDAVKRSPLDHLGATEIAMMAQAVDLYQGELLQGWYQDWCIYERERVQQMYLSMLDRLVQCCMRDGHYAQGIEFATLVLRGDPAREYTHRQLMHLHALAGDRTSALRQFARCTEILHKELGVEPATRTHQLYRSICNNLYPGADGGHSFLRTATSDNDANLTQIAGQLHQLQLQLDAITAAFDRHFGAHRELQ